MAAGVFYALRFVVSVIAALQVAALLYGGSVVFKNRPGYLVFAVDRFEVVAATLVDNAAIPDAELRRTLANPIPIVYASLPDDHEVSEAILFEVISGGADIEMRPELYKPFLENFDRVFINRWSNKFDPTGLQVSAGFPAPVLLSRGHHPATVA